MQMDEDIHVTFEHMIMEIFYKSLVKNEITKDNLK